MAFVRFLYFWICTAIAVSNLIEERSFGQDEQQAIEQASPDDNGFFENEDFDLQEFESTQQFNNDQGVGNSQDFNDGQELENDEIDDESFNQFGDLNQQGSQVQSNLGSQDVDLNQGTNQLLLGEPEGVNSSGLTEGGLNFDDGSNERLATEEGLAFSEEVQPDPVKTAALPVVNDFAGAPPLPGTLRFLADGEGPEDYVVERGDTLFDVCDQLIDEPGYWPKLWSFNPAIRNPHFIYPGMTLRFYPGDSETPPFLQVVSEEDFVPIDRQSLDDAQLIVADLMKVDGSLDFKGVDVVGPADLEMPEGFDGKFIEAGARYQGESTQFMLPGFILGEEPESLGTVLGGINREYAIGPFSKVMIKADGVEAGQTYTVLRYLQEVEDPVEGDFLGYHYEFVAQITIENIQDDVAVGRSKIHRSAVMVGDVIVPYRSTIRSIPLYHPNGGEAVSEAHVVALSKDKTIYSGAGRMLFVGESLGVGQYYRVYQGYAKSLVGQEVLEDLNDSEIGHPVATVRIVESGEGSSIAYVVRSSRPLMVGDRLSPF